MPKHKNLLAIRQRGQFSNFSGDPQVNPLNQHANYGGYGYGHMSGNPAVQQVGGVTAELNFLIRNTDDGNALVVDLMQANEGFVDAFGGLTDSAGTTAAAGKGLIVTVNGESHQKYKNRSISQPFLIEGIRITYPTSTQLNQSWELRASNNNESSVKTYTPNTKKTAGQFDPLQIDDKSFQMLINADSGIRFLVEAAPSATVATEIAISMNIRAMSNISENLKGRPALGYNPNQVLGGNNLY